MQSWKEAKQEGASTRECKTSAVNVQCPCKTQEEEEKKEREAADGGKKGGRNNIQLGSGV